MGRGQMRVVFIGTPDFSVPSLAGLVEAGYNVIGVITAPDRKSGRGMKLQKSAVKQFAEAKGIPVLQPTNLKNPDFIAELTSLKADIQVVIAFRMLPEMVWNMPHFGTINLHASLLPNYRGAAPINWAIINGETETGLSTFKLQHEIDTGNLLKQLKMDITESDTAGSLHDKMMAAGADVILGTLDGVREGNLIEQPQVTSADHKQAPKIFKSTCEIDWNKSGLDIGNLIRGLCPYPTARTQYGDKLLKIYDSQFIAQNHERSPGTTETDHTSFLRFYCLDGTINVTDVQLEGKRRMGIADLLRGMQN